MWTWRRIHQAVLALGLACTGAWAQAPAQERAKSEEVVQWVQQLLQTGKPIDTLHEVLQQQTGAAPNAEQVVMACNRLVEEAYQVGAYPQGLALATQTHAYADAQLGAEHPDTLTSLHNLAALYQAQGRYGEAEPLSLRVFATRERVLGAEHPHTLTSLHSLAFLYQTQGRYGEAEPLYQSTLATYERVLGAEHPHTLAVQLNYIVVLVNNVQPQRVLQQLQLLEPRLLTFAGQQLHTTLQEQVRRIFLLSHSSFQNVVFTLAVQPTATPELRAFAADVLLRWKQVQRDEDAYLAGLMRTSPDPVIKHLGQAIMALRREVSHLSNRPQADPTALREKHRALDAAEVALAQHSHRYKRRLVVHGLQRNDVRSHLQQDSALLELRAYNPFDFKAGKVGEQRWLALLLPASTGEGPEVTLYDLGPVAGSVQRWLDLRRHDERSPQPSQHLLGDLASLQRWEMLRQQDAHHAATRLYDHLFGALDSQLQRFPTLFIAPDSFVHLLPLARLVLPDGRYWIERQNLRQLQTGRDLLPDVVDTPPAGLLALGSIDYSHFEGDTTPAAPQQHEAHRQLADTVGQLKPLGHSGSEAAGIRAYYWDVYRGNAEVWQGREASETRLKALAKPPRVLHLATHGFYLPLPKDRAERPLTLSGLALAGANQGMQGHLNVSGDDGILYALEVQHLNLEGTELVALSACKTGQGEVDYTEGVYGLVRAFRMAGARRVLMTLTNVDDADAERFMLRFYANWLTSTHNPNRDPVLALQQTRASFLHDPDPALREPRVWAPYVLVETGAGR